MHCAKARDFEKGMVINMIQDIAPKMMYNQFQDKKVENNSFMLIYNENEVLVIKTEDTLSFPRYEEMEASLTEARFLFRIDEEEYFLGTLKEYADIPENATWEKLGIFREKKYGYRIFAGITGHQLYCWYRDTQFCGRCGSKLEHSHIERMMQCPNCCNMIYPKISPAVIVAVMDHDKILLTKYAGRDYKKYALIAGFTEIGETMEETVRREVMEEVGVKVKNIRYYKSQPWAFSGTMLMGFFADLDGESTIKMDENELAVAEWVDREFVPHDYEEISLTWEMMGVFHNHQEPIE